MANQNAVLKQPDYYFQIKLKAYVDELIKRLTAEDLKYSEVYKSESRYTDKSIMALFYMQAITHHIEDLKNYSNSQADSQLNALQQYFKQIKGDSVYKNNVKLNVEKLSNLEKQFIAELQSAKLVKETPELVTTWYLDTSHIKSSSYFPIAQSCATCHRGSAVTSKPNQITADARTMPVAFQYADSSNHIIHDSYIIYWKYAKGGKKGQFAAPSKELMIPIGIGYTDRSGNLHQSLPMSSVTSGLKIYESKESDGSVSHQLELLTSSDFANKWQKVNANYDPKPHLTYYSDICNSGCHTSTQTQKMIMGPSKKKLAQIAYQRLNMGKFDASADYGFMAYPMDHGEIRTLDLDKIAAMKVPAGGSTAQHIAFKDSISKTVSIATDNRLSYLKVLNKGHIALHCTLPEWDKRLREAYDDANYWFQIMQLCKDVHRKQESKLEHMKIAVNAQIRFPFAKQNDTQYGNRNILLNGVMDAKEIIHKRYSNYAEYSGQTRKSGGAEIRESEQVQVIIKDFNTKIKILWDLITTPALKAELAFYCDHVSKKIANGEPPIEDKAKGIKLHYPGPYMAIEPEWMRIIFTLNDCYSMLANSPELKEKIWDFDLKHGYETALNLKGLDQFYSTWATEIQASDVGKDFENDKIFSKDQSSFLSEKATPPKADESISSKILSFFDEILQAEKKYYGDSKLKDFLGLAIPTLGPPNLVQTMTNLYGSFSFKKLQNHSNKTSHMRIFISYYYLSGYIKFDKSGKVARGYSESYKFMLTVFVRGPSNNPSMHAMNAKKSLPSIINSLKVDDGHDTAFYKKYVGTKKMLAIQGLYYLLNLGLVIQSFSHTKKSDERGNLQLVDIISSANTLVSVAHSAASGMLLTTKAYALWKNIDITDSKFANTLDKVGTYLGHHMLVLATVSSWIDVKRYSEEGDTSAEIRAWIDLSANMAMFIGYAMRKETTSILLKAGSKAIAKYLAREVVLGGIGATGIGAIIFAIGTIVSTVLLIYDIAKLAWAFLEDWIYSTPEYRMFSVYWNAFKAKSKVSDLSKLVDNFSKYKQLPPRLLGSPESRRQIAKVYDFNPYLTYQSEKAQGKGDKLIATMKTIDEYALKYCKIFDTGVIWNKLNWRAVIPLHQLGMKYKDINELVSFPEEIEYNGYSISEVRALTSYYDRLREHEKGYSEQELSDYFNFKCKSLSPGTVAKLLEMGKFTAREGMKLPGGQAFAGDNFYHYHFYIPEEYSVYGLDEFPYYLRNELYVTNDKAKRREIWRNIFSLSSHDLAMAKAEDNKAMEDRTNGSEYGCYNIDNYANDAVEFGGIAFGYRYRSWASSKGDYITAKKKQQYETLLKFLKDEFSAGTTPCMTCHVEPN